MNFKKLKDDALLLLHKHKKVDVLFIFYNRYYNRCCGIVYRALSNSKYLKTLFEEKNIIIVESIRKAIETFDVTKGKAFYSYLGQIVFNETITRIREFAKDPLSNFVSLDASVNDEDSDISLSDTLVFADHSASPIENFNLKEQISWIDEIYHERRYNNMRRIIDLKLSGYSYHEIAKKLKMSDKSVRSSIYRIKKMLSLEFKKKMKK